MPIRPHNPDNKRSVKLGAAHENHNHSHDDLEDVSANDHHDEDHASRHEEGGADELELRIKQIHDALAEIFMHMGA